MVTKFISEINFRSSAKKGDIVEIGIDVVAFGITSMTLSCEVRNKMMRETIITVDKIIMVSIGTRETDSARKTKVEFVKDRLGDSEN